ncbi:MAG TPA: hypothetical protein DEP51_00455 [Clostridiales bacterium]|nr:hypothetical protein [Clostridiales bacterium]
MFLIKKNCDVSNLNYNKIKFDIYGIFEKASIIKK